MFNHKQPFVNNLLIQRVSTSGAVGGAGDAQPLEVERGLLTDRGRASESTSGEGRSNSGNPVVGTRVSNQSRTITSSGVGGDIGREGTTVDNAEGQAVTGSDLGSTSIDVLAEL